MVKQCDAEQQLFTVFLMKSPGLTGFGRSHYLAKLHSCFDAGKNIQSRRVPACEFLWDLMTKMTLVTLVTGLKSGLVYTISIRLWKRDG
jgi:hypothetical protein